MHMKKIGKVILYLITTLFVLLLGVISYVSFFLPSVGNPEAITVERTPARIERGKYLATSVMLCVDCHSKRDWSKFSGPIIVGTEGQGGEKFDEHFGFPGTFYSKNITPYALDKWTDGELFRTITTGVDKNGKAIFPIMPYHYYGQLDREDIYSVIAYIRNLKPIQKDVLPSSPKFPFSIIENTIPQKANLSTKPAETDSLAYGKYMATASGCVECHTRPEKGKIIQELAFSGGREFALPTGTVRSANITPHPTDGLGKWTAEQFVKRFAIYQDSSYQIPSIKEKDFNTVMPWMMYSKMKASDLRAIFRYLQTQKPIANKPEKFTAKS